MLVRRMCFVAITYVSFTGCAYFESNRVIYEKKVFGNVKLFRDENMPSIDLVMAPDEESTYSIVEDCNQVYLDSNNARIAVSIRLNDYQNRFYEVKVLNKFSQNPVTSFYKEEINKKRFDSLAERYSLIYTRID